MSDRETLQEELNRAREALMVAAGRWGHSFQVYPSEAEWPREYNGVKISYPDAEAAVEHFRESLFQEAQSALARYAYYLRKLNEQQ